MVARAPETSITAALRRCEPAADIVRVACARAASLPGGELTRTGAKHFRALAREKEAAYSKHRVPATA